MSKPYVATATREGRWWAIDVDGVGVTQSRTLADAPRWAAGLVEAMTGETDVEIELHTSVPGVHLDEAKTAQQRVAEAEHDLRESSQTVKQAVARILRAGVSQQDTAAILEVSRQRVQQLSKQG